MLALQVVVHNSGVITRGVVLTELSSCGNTMIPKRAPIERGKEKAWYIPGEKRKLFIDHMIKQSDDFCRKNMQFDHIRKENLYMFFGLQEIARFLGQSWHLILSGTLYKEGDQWGV